MSCYRGNIIAVIFPKEPGNPVVFVFELTDAQRLRNLDVTVWHIYTVAFIQRGTYRVWHIQEGVTYTVERYHLCMSLVSIMHEFSSEKDDKIKILFRTFTLCFLFLDFRGIICILGVTYKLNAARRYRI